ncbi:class I SAM-dependent methyltransferase [Anabaena minutissima FACHB-250]|nr:class I SAM-dependent methyltransferase [Anabaena minutissima FACHB-250]
MALNQVFSHIYKVNLWESSESLSGRGSEISVTTKIRESLPILLQNLKVQSIVDAPCGDFNWMSQISLDGIDYVGLDIVPEVIEKAQKKSTHSHITFRTADITNSDIPKADLIICRDCLVHLSYQNIFRIFHNFQRSKSTYLLTTTYPNLTSNRDVPSGCWRALNLEKPPFNFGQPLYLLDDPSDDTGKTDKSLALWRLEDIILSPPSPWSLSSLKVSTISGIRRFIPSFML